MTQWSYERTSRGFEITLTNMDVDWSDLEGFIQRKGGPIDMPSIHRSPDAAFRCIDELCGAGFIVNHERHAIKNALLGVS